MTSTVTKGTEIKENLQNIVMKEIEIEIEVVMEIEIGKEIENITEIVGIGMKSTMIVGIEETGAGQEIRIVMIRGILKGKFKKMYKRNLRKPSIPLTIISCIHMKSPCLCKFQCLQFLENVEKDNVHDLP